MRKVKLYGIYDKVAMMFGEMPFKAINEDDAKRAFIGLIQEGNNQIAKNPHDYILVEIGEYDRIVGKVSGYDITKNVMTGAEALRPQEVKDET